MKAAILLNLFNDTVLGTDRKFLSIKIQEQEFTDEQKAILGDLSAEELQNTLGADPVVLPEVGSELETKLVLATFNGMYEAVGEGFELVEGDSTDTAVWNQSVTAFSEWLIAAGTPAVAEQEMEPLTDADAAAIVDEANSTPEGEAALQEVVNVVAEIVGDELPAAAAVGVLKAYQLRKHVNAAQVVNEAILQKAKDAYDALRDIVEMGSANSVILEKLSTHHNALPESVESVEQ